MPLAAGPSSPSIAPRPRTPSRTLGTHTIAMQIGYATIGTRNAAAERAVSQWRFRPRENPVNARIMLSFEAE